MTEASTEPSAELSIPVLSHRRVLTIIGALMLGYPKYTYNVKLPRKARAVTML